MAEYKKQDVYLGAFEKGIVIVSLIVATLSGYLLVDERHINKWLKPSSLASAPLGQMLSPNRDVRHRHRGSYIWFNVSNDAEVYNGDSIFTGEDSNTSLNLDKGLSFDIQSNSLLVLTERNNEITLDLRVGQIVASAKTPVAKKLKLKTKLGDIDVSVGKNTKSFKIEQSAKKAISIAAIDGDLDVKIGGQNQKIQKNEKVKVDAAGKVEKVKVDLKLMVPRENAVVIPDATDRSIFAWKSSHETATYKLEVAEDPYFNKMVARAESLDVLRSSLRLPDDTKYYWRVIASGEGIESSESPVGSFSLISPEPVQLYFPYKNMRWSVEDFEQENHYVWSEKSLIDSYEIQVASDLAFAQVVQSDVVDRPNLKMRPLPAGQYYWRVRYQSHGTAFAWSIPFSFIVEAPAPPPVVAKAPPVPAEPAPVIDTPPEVAQQSKIEPLPEPEPKPDPIQEKPSELPPLQVRGPEEVEFKLKDPNDLNSITNPPRFESSEGNGLVLQFSKDPSFKKLLDEQKTDGRVMVWSKPIVGTVYWRAKDQSEGRKWSEVKDLSLSVAPFVKAPVIEKKLRFKHVSSFEKNHSVELSWPKIPLAKGYQVTLNGKSYSSKQNKINLRLPASTNQSFTVAATDENGKLVSKPSAPVKVNVRATLFVSPPKLSSPENNAAIASLGSADEFLIFEWSSIKNATEYELEFSTSPDFKNVFYKKKIKDSSFIMDQVIDPRRVYWRVRAYVKEHKSKWSQPRTFSL